MAIRTRASQQLASWYAPLYSLLMRVVHPIAFGAFALTALTVAGWVLIEVAGDDSSGVIGLAVFVALLAALPYAHSLVLTPVTSLLAIVLVVGWAIAIPTFPPSHSALVVLYGAALVSVIVRLAGLVSVARQRASSGLLNLLLPAAIGTVLGAVPTMLGTIAVITGEDATARTIAVPMLWFAGAAALLFASMHLLADAGEASIVEVWSTLHEMRPVSAAARATDAIIGSYLPPARAWRSVTPAYSLEVTTGTVETRYPDLPVAWLTCVALELPEATRDRSSIDLWLRSRGLATDTVVPHVAATSRIRTESIELEDRHEVHVAHDVDPVAAMQALDPRVIDAARRLGRLQLCRSRGTLVVYAVGGVVSGTELDSMLGFARDVAVALDMLDPSVQLA